MIHLNRVQFLIKTFLALTIRDIYNNLKSSINLPEGPIV